VVVALASVLGAPGAAQDKAAAPGQELPRGSV